MSNTADTNESAAPQDNKVYPSGGPSNQTIITTATSSAVASLEEQIVTQIAGEQQPSNEEQKKDGEKKRPASEINGGGEQSSTQAKKVKTVATAAAVAAKGVGNAGGLATPSIIPSTAGSTGPKSRRRRPNSRRVPDNQGKHEPYAPPGTKFSWTDNGHIDRTKSKTGQEDKSRYRLKLKATTGIEYTFVYTRRKIIDWNKKKDVAHLNTWRNQIIKRKLDGETIRNRDEGYRPHWSEKEKAVLSSLVRDRIRKKGRQLNPDDWNKIAEKHNERFKGVTVHIGEKLPGAMNSKGKMTDGKVLKKSHVLGDRTRSAIKAQFGRWPDLAAMVQEELRKLGIVQVEGDNEDEASEGEDGEDEEEEEGSDVGSGEDLDLGLEDPSDDEDAGRRLAST